MRAKMLPALFTKAVLAAAAGLSMLVANTAAQVTPTAGMTADSYCGQGYCLTAVMSDAQTVNYTLVIPQGGKQIGWWGIGQGTRMAGANMAVNWINPDMSLVTSHRSTGGEYMPTEAAVTVQSFKVNSDVSKTSPTMTVFSWIWPMSTKYPQNAQQNIMAYASQSPSGASSATIQMHDRYEQDVTLDLTKPYNGSSPAGIASSMGSVASSSGNSGGAMRDTGKMSVRVFIVHMVFMIFGWQLCFPIGILLARYGRTLITWYPYHRAIQSVGYLFTFIAFFLAVGNVSAIGNMHLANTHERLGVALFILLFVQVLMGVFAHQIRKRRGLRILGYIHIPLGLILYGLSVWQIHEGFEVWQWQPPAAASYVIYAWAAFMFVLYVGGFALLPRELRQNRDEKPGGYRGSQSPAEDMPVMGQP